MHLTFNHIINNLFRFWEHWYTYSTLTVLHFYFIWYLIIAWTCTLEVCISHLFLSHANFKCIFHFSYPECILTSFSFSKSDVVQTSLPQKFLDLWVTFTCWNKIFYCDLCSFRKSHNSASLTLLHCTVDKCYSRSQYFNFATK